MDNLRENALARHIPLVREDTGRALQDECKKNSPKNILEIGTAVGYSAILMAEVCEGEIYTIEKDRARFEEAERNFQAKGLTARVHSFLGDAKDVLEEFCQKGMRFDFVFLDGPKGQYIHYYKLLKELLAKDGVIFADNIKLLGMVENFQHIPHKNRTMTRNMIEFLHTIQEDDDFEVKLYDVEDGYLVAKRINF